MKNKFIILIFIKFFIYGFFLSFLSFFLGEAIFSMKNNISFFDTDFSNLFFKGIIFYGI